MQLKSLISTAIVGSVIVGTSLMVTNCTSMVTEEQLAKLQDLRRQERQLQDDIGKKSTDLKKLESEISARQKEVNNCDEDLKFVKNKLDQWPNVWPDYSPAAEPEVR
ncbi:MAG: hypothetical protein ACLFQX_06060 [Candidatus Kapaibacterium sp.]